MGVPASPSRGARSGSRDWRAASGYALRLSLTAVGVWLWWWGLNHWPHPPAAYGTGFQAWVAGLVAVTLAWCRPGLPERSGRMTLAAWLAVGTVAVAAVLRWYRVVDVPYALHDEGLTYWPLEQMRAGQAANLFSRIDRYTTGGPGMLLVLHWLLLPISKNILTAHRYAGATWGILSVGATFLLARRLISPWVGVAASMALTVSYWHVISSRFQPALCTAMGAASIWWAVARACESRRTGDAVVAGLVSGLALMLYDPIKVMWVAVPAWWLWHALVTRGFARRTLGPMLVVVAVGYMTMAPLLRAAGWRQYFARTSEVTALGDSFRARLLTEPKAVVATQGKRMLRVVEGGAEVASNHFSQDPLLNVLEVGAGALGLLIAGGRMLRAGNPDSWKLTIAPIWLLSTVIAVGCSSVPDASYRLAVALPAWAVLAGIGVVTPVQFMIRHLPRLLGFTLAAALGLGLLGYDVWENGSRALRYFQTRNYAGERDVLARSIAAGPADAVYYVEETPANYGAGNLLALTGHQSMRNIPNLVVDVPDLVDTTRPATFVLAYWSLNLSYLQALYPEARSEKVIDPLGRTAGYAVTVAPGMVATRPACGLRRRCGRGERGEVDPQLVFLDLARTCADGVPPEIEWRGFLAVPESPAAAIGVSEIWVRTTVEVDGATMIEDLYEGGEGEFPICLAPGPHSIVLRARPIRGYPTLFNLWWQFPGGARSAVPCQALRPLDEPAQCSVPG